MLEVGALWSGLQRGPNRKTITPVLLTHGGLPHVPLVSCQCLIILSPFVSLALSHSPWHLYTSLYAWVSWIHVYPIFHIVCFWRQSLKSVFTAIIKAVNLHLKSCITFILRPKYILWLHEIFHGVRNLITLTHTLSNTMTVGGCHEIRQQQRVL